MKNVILAIMLLMLSGCKSMYGDGSNWTELYDVVDNGSGYSIRDPETRKLIYDVVDNGNDYKAYY